MPYSKQKVKKLAKLERKYYTKYILKFDIRTSLLKVRISNPISTLSKVRILNSSTLSEERISNSITLKSTYIEEYVNQGSSVVCSRKMHCSKENGPMNSYLQKQTVACRDLQSEGQMLSQCQK
jgi:hypothetical protein